MQLGYTFWAIALGLLCPWSSIAQDTVDSIPLSVTFDEAVVITGEAAPTEAKAAVHPIRVIDKETIARRASLNLEELLQQQLGVRMNQDAVLGGQLNLNGLGGEYVQIMIDGVPVVGRNGGNIDLGRIDLSTVERVEITEGPMSVMYGTNALGGTINIITKKHQHTTLTGQLGTQVESVGRYYANAQLGANWKGVTLQGNYAFNHFEGFSTDTLRAQSWNPKTQHHVRGLLRKDFGGNHNLQYRFSYLDEFIEDRGIIRLKEFPTLAYANDFEFRTKTQDHSLQYRGQLGQDYHLNILGAYNWFWRSNQAFRRSMLDNPEEERRIDSESDTTIFDAWHVRGMFASQYSGKLDFMVGLDLRYEQTVGERIREFEAGDRANIGDYAAFANLRYRPVESLTIQPSVRVAYNTRYQTPVTYGLNIRWSFLKDFTLRAAYARGFRAPSLKELYLDFVDANHHIKGNPNLKAEQSHSTQLTVDFEKKWKDKQQLNIELSGFYNQIENQITLFDYQADSLGNFLPSEQATFQYSYFNKANFQTWGVGLRLNYQFKNLTIRLQGLFNAQSNQLEEDFEALQPFTHTVQFTQEVTYTLPKYALSFSLFRTDFDRQIIFSQLYNPITQENELQEAIIPGYALMDMTITKGFKDRMFELSAGVKNIMNVTDIQRVGQASTGAHTGGSNIPTAMGRIFFIRLRYNLNKKL